MPRRLTPQSSLTALRLEARRWLSALRAGDVAALDRLRAAWPHAPAPATLRAVQHALAREHGLSGWAALRRALDDLALDRQTRAERIAALLRQAWDGDLALARRLLARDPAIAGASLFTAAACGDIDEVRRRLEADPRLARATDPERGWTALAHACFGRLDAMHAVAIATLLLDAGADVTFAFDDGWGNAFTLLTGVAGQGERRTPPHPQAAALAELLLDRGADPFDRQLLYNTALGDDDVEWLDRLWTHSERQGRTADWSSTDRPIGGRVPLGALDVLLGLAVSRDHRRRAAWLLAHGASATTVHAYSGRPLHTEARLAGHGAMAALLEAHGATAEALDGDSALLAMLMSDRPDAIRAQLAADPALVRRPAALLHAAAAGRTDAVALLLELGADVDAADHEGATALHRAAQAGSLPTVERLLAAGATIDRRDARWRATPLRWADVLGRATVGDRLARDSRDVRALAAAGRLDRLAEVLHTSPALADQGLDDVEAPTPLFCLPDDEDDAAAVAQLLLDHGADPSRRDRQGRTAEEAARARGLDEAAALMADHRRGSIP